MAEKSKIQIEVETKLADAKKDIGTLSSKGGFKGNKQAETQVEQIVKQLDSLSKVTSPNLKQLTTINSLFSQLTNILLKVASSIKASSKELLAIQNRITTLTTNLDKARSEKGGILKKGRVNKDTNKYELFTTYQNEEIKAANIKNAKGNAIKTADTFYKKFDANGQPVDGAFQDPAAAKALYDRLRTAQETNATRLHELNDAINNYKLELQKAQDELKQQSSKEGNPLTSGLIDRGIFVSETIQEEKDRIHAEQDAQKATSSPDAAAKQIAPNKGLGHALKQFSLYAVVIRTIKNALREAVTTVKELDKYLTEQAMVTGKTREETYALVGQYQELALACGATTKEIAQVTTEYMKQGKSTAEALVLTEAAVKAAKVARVSVGDSVNYLTTALNGFRLEATEAMRVSDIFASVAAASATDYDELAIALSKVASQANLAGMSIEYTTALLTKGLETTREAPETMGTALKTIIARMREMSDYGETLEGDTDINNVESQLAYVGIALKNEQGELRSTEEVLDELGKKWDTLNKNQQAALAKALAGTRQQSRLIAMMDDYERVIELQEIAERSTGATSAQAGVYLEGMEASLNKIQVAWEKIIMTITNSEVLIGVIGTIGDILSNIGDALENEWVIWTAIVPVVALIISSIIAKIKMQRTFNKAKLQEIRLEQDKAILEKSDEIARKKKYLDLLKAVKLAKVETKEKAEQALLDSDKTNDLAAYKALTSAKDKEL